MRWAVGGVFVVSSASANARSRGARVGAMAQRERAAWSAEEERMRFFFLSMLERTAEARHSTSKETFAKSVRGV